MCTETLKKEMTAYNKKHLMTNTHYKQDWKGKWQAGKNNHNTYDKWRVKSSDI